MGSRSDPLVGVLRIPTLHRVRQVLADALDVTVEDVPEDSRFAVLCASQFDAVRAGLGLRSLHAAADLTMIPDVQELTIREVHERIVSLIVERTFVFDDGP